MFGPGDKVRRIHVSTFAGVEHLDELTIKEVTGSGNLIMQGTAPPGALHDPNSYELIEKFIDNKRIYVCSICTNPCYLVVTDPPHIPRRCVYSSSEPAWREKND